MDRPTLFQVYPTDNFNVYLYYDSEEIRLYDCKWVLNETGFLRKSMILLFSKNFVQ